MGGVAAREAEAEVEVEGEAEVEVEAEVEAEAKAVAGMVMVREGPRQAEAGMASPRNVAVLCAEISEMGVLTSGRPGAEEIGAEQERGRGGTLTRTKTRHLRRITRSGIPLHAA